MRLVGPDCFGVAVPGIGLDATFAASPPRPGVAGLVMQSGGLGFALVDQLSRLGIGISSFASVGTKLDVSSNDLLLWWEHDGVTKVAVLYIESFGNPRKFARTARRVGAAMPVLTVLRRPSAAGQQSAAIDSGVRPAGQPRSAVRAGRGHHHVRGFGELIEATALLATQPVPAGRTVAIVSNVGSAGGWPPGLHRPGADCLPPARPDRGRLRYRHPHGPESGPVETRPPFAARISASAWSCSRPTTRCTRSSRSSCRPARPATWSQAIQEADVAHPAGRGRAQPARICPAAAPARRQGQVPAYGYPEAAVARAGARRRLRGLAGRAARPGARLPRRRDGEGPRAGARVSPPGTAGRLARRPVRRPTCCAATGYRSQAKARVGLTETAARTDGVEVIVRVAADPTFGPLVMFGLGGPTGTQEPPRRSRTPAARLTPLTDTDADKLIRSVRSAPLLSGAGGRPAADLVALRDLLLRVSRLADDLPEVAEPRPRSGHRPAGPGRRRGRPGQAGPLPAAGPVPAPAALIIHLDTSVRGSLSSGTENFSVVA